MGGEECEKSLRKMREYLNFLCLSVNLENTISYLYGLIYIIYIGCKIDHVEILRVFAMKALQQWCLCVPLELQVQIPILTRPRYLCVLKESKLSTGRPKALSL